MDIRFISSLTEDDENRFAPALVNAIGHLLRQFPIIYTVRIETTGGKVFQCSHSASDGDRAERLNGPDRLRAGDRERRRAGL